MQRSRTEIEALLKDSGFEILHIIPMSVLMNNPVNAHRIFQYLWFAISLPARRNEMLGQLTGAFLYPVESVLTGILRDTPSTKVVICQKR